MLESMLTYLQTHAPELMNQILTHLGISLLSLLLAALIGIPCGYLAAQSPKSEKWVTGPFQVLRVVPSLAVLVLLIPLAGTGIVPAAIALTVLAVPPILLNTIVGFRDVPAFMVETAAGVGMTEQEALWQVRIPLALPLMLSGVRTALVEVVASATLAAKIGAGGLGEVIFTGLGLNRSDLLVLGGVLVLLTGNSPMEAYAAIVRGAFGSPQKICELFTKLIPILIMAFGVSIAYRAQLWNIGAGGQFIMSSISATAVALYIPIPIPLRMILSFIVAIAAGALWAGIAAWLKNKFNANEVITTLMLTYIADYFLMYLVNGPMQDPASDLTQSALIPDEMRLARLFGTYRLHSGIFLLILELCLKHEKISFERELYPDDGDMQRELTKTAVYRLQ